MAENSISGGHFEGPVVMAGAVHLHQPPERVRVVRMLSQPVSRFVNRTSVLDRLDGLHRDRTATGVPTIVVLSGVGGIGKTETALRWLQRHRADFTGHQFYANLSPQGPGAPRDPAAVLEHFLAELGVPKEDRPHDPEALAARFRSLTSDGPVVVVLDNAVAAAQVRLLLPGSDQGVVLVTSRLRLTGLRGTHDAHLVDLPPLAEVDGLALLGPVEDLPDAAAHRQAVLRACGGLPLAVRIAAALLEDALPGGLAEFVAQLADRKTRLSAFAVPDDVSVRDVFDVSYRCLPPVPARLYRLLGLHPVRTVGLATVQALAGDLETTELRSALAVLVDASLLGRQSADRFVMHDLVHDHARGCADQEEFAAERAAGVRRVVRHYLALALAGDSAISSRWRYEPEPPPATAVRPRFESPEHAVQELAAHREALPAVVSFAREEGLPALGWQLCQALGGFYLRTGFHSDWIASHTVGLTCAVESGDLLAVARLHYQLGLAHLDRAAPVHDDLDQARDHLTHALDIARALNHHRTESTAWECLGLLALRRTDPAEALDCFTKALRALADVDHPRGRAILESHRGRALTALGDYDEAARRFRSAGELFASLTDPQNPGVSRPDRYNQAKSLTHYAENRRRAGHLTDASVALAEAAELMPGQGSDRELGGIHLLYGDVQSELGDQAGAVEQWRTALDLLEGGHDPRGAEVRARLAAAGAAGQRPADEDPERHG